MGNSINQQTANKTVTINSMEDVIYYLSNSVNQVSSNVNNINLQVDDVQSQVNDMKNNVQSLENEIRTFMNEMKRNAMVNDAKQTIMISQIEYNKKYKHHDDARRRILGLLQSIDINVIKKSTMETISEETIINNPDYWLANALVALCYWYSDNKPLAESALKQALKNSEEKTSFLFCLIHLRGNRISTAIKWLKKYLTLQDPTNMDSKIILLLDALCSGVFGKEIIDVVVQQIKEWELRLNGHPQCERNQIAIWENYFRGKTKIAKNKYEYIDQFVLEKEKVNNIVNISSSHINMIKEFKQTINEKENTKSEHQNKIDELINLLIFDYEKEELDLKTEIDKNNAIINATKLEEPIVQNKSYDKNDFYTHISNICIDNNVFNIGIYTKKMAIAMLKNYIIQAYKNVCQKEDVSSIDLNILIEDWLGTTRNGANEFELKNSLSNFIKNKYQGELDKMHLFTKDMLISIAVGIVLIILGIKYLWVILLVLVALLIFNGYRYYKNLKAKEAKQADISLEKEAKNILLMCTITDIVDYYFECEERNKNHNDFIKYLESLDYSEYIRSYTENKRSIIIGEKR